MITKDFRFLLRDSVGIRTQDPQLRRLLLYPAELPNRSLCCSDGCGAVALSLDRKVGAKIMLFSGFATICLADVFMSAEVQL